MGVASYNRGSEIVRRDADERAAAAIPRAAREAAKDESARLRDRVAVLEHDLARARRCIAELRRSKDARLADARESQSRSDAVIHTLTRIAFPRDTKEEG